MIVTLPLIHHFSALTQSGILAFLLLISYVNTRARYIVLGLLFAYLGVKLVVPIIGWGFTLFKWVAMLGFYWTYFQIGLGFIVTGFGVMTIFLSDLTRQLEKDKPRRGAGTGTRGSW